MQDSTTYNFRKRYNIYTNKKVLLIIMKNYLTERQCDNTTYKDLYDSYKELLQFYKNQAYLNEQYCKLIVKELRKRNILIKE